MPVRLQEDLHQATKYALPKHRSRDAQSSSGRLSSRSARGQVMIRELKFGFAALALVPCLAEAQIVSGRVRSSNDLTPLVGAVIRVVGSTGELASGLSGAQGLFRIAAPSGSVRIEVDMIGHRAWSMAQGGLGRADSLSIDVLLDVAPVQLEDIVAESRNLCTGISTAPGGVVDVLWRDARAALAAQEVARAGGRLSFLVETFERDVAADSLSVVRDVRRRMRSRSPEAFRSPPVATLANEGFLEAREDGLYLYGPSPSVLLHDWFVETHCLGVLPPAPHDSLIAITFTPNRDRRVPEIRGTLRLDARSRDLRSIEFEYVALPPSVPSGSSGHARFERLEDGSVIIREWAIESPMLELGEILAFGHRRPVERVWATRETGGEVLRAQRGTTELYRATRATIQGIAFDSVNRAPLAGARVFIVGSGFAARTDSIGAYRLEDLPAGTYRVSFDHPRLTAFGFRHAPREVALARGDTVQVDLAIPSSARLLVSPEDAARLDSIAAVGRFLGVNLDRRIPEVDEAQRAVFDPGRPARVLLRAVRHEDSQAIAGVAVSLLRSGTREVVASGYTDASGQLEFASVPGGEYDSRH
jgi:hypothetical protein